MFFVKQDLLKDLIDLNMSRGGETPQQKRNNECRKKNDKRV